MDMNRSTGCTRVRYYEHKAVQVAALSTVYYYTCSGIRNSEYKYSEYVNVHNLFCLVREYLVHIVLEYWSLDFTLIVVLGVYIVLPE